MKLAKRTLFFLGAATAMHKPTGAYIMWAGSPYAHLHVMGRP